LNPVETRESGFANLAQYSQVTYQCTKKKDGEKGVVVVREKPEDNEAIIDWLSRLPVDIEYRGERLAAIRPEGFPAASEGRTRLVNIGAEDCAGEAPGWPLRPLYRHF